VKDRGRRLAAVTPRPHRTLREPLAALAAALVCAGCGNNPAGGGHPTASATAAGGAGSPGAVASGGAQAAGLATPSGGAAAGTGGVTSPGAAAASPGGAAVHPATAADPPSAAAGTYALTGTMTSSTTTQPSPSQTSGGGTLVVSAPQATAAGSEEDETYKVGGSSLSTHDVFAADSSVSVSRSGSAAFTPALPIVPAGLHDGMSWGPVSFTSGTATGTLSGHSGQTAQRSIGGVFVTVVPISLHLELKGSFHGTPYTATSDESMDWAPSLHLAVHVVMVTDAQYAAAHAYHSRIEVSLLSIHPS
jgi:hypothetical protein